MKKLLSLLLCAALLAGLAVPALAEETEAPVTPYTVPADVAGKAVILHTNDVHGAVENYAKVATLKKMFEDAGAEVLLVDAGDFAQGETYVSVSQGETAVELMNLVGYDAACLGNHEFDYGYENLKEITKDAKFHIVSANTLYDGKVAFQDHVAFTTADGVKVGVFGLETPETATKAHPAKIKGVSFEGGEALYNTAKDQVEALEQTQCDYIVCLGHLGIDQESAANANRSIDLLEKVHGIDVFIDGHSHSTLEEVKAATNGTGKVGDTVLTSTGTKLESVGVVILGEEITVDSVPVAAISGSDETVAQAAQAVVDAVKELYGQVFAKSEVDLNGERDPGNRTQETNLGDLICDAMVWQVTKDGSLGVPKENVVAITNGGGIRASIAAGDMTRDDVNKVLPFGNTVATVTITGDALLEALEASTFCTPTAIGGFPQVSGLRFRVNTAAEFDAGENYPGTTYAKPKSVNRVTIDSVNGYSFDPNATYAVVTNDFVAAGGDTYYAFSTSPDIVDTGVPLDEALMAYITEELGGVVGTAYAQTRGRITVEEQRPAMWYDAAVKAVTEKGIMKGTGNGFEPEGVVTRATVFQALFNLSGAPEQENRMATFPDAQGKWYEKAARWAEQLELTNGTGAGLFEGERNITRQELVTILHRYARQGGVDVSLGEDVNLLAGYLDAELVSSWALEPFQWAVGSGAMAGKTTGAGLTLAPEDTATRAELAQILTNIAGFFPPAA